MKATIQTGLFFYSKQYTWVFLNNQWLNHADILFKFVVFKPNEGLFRQNYDKFH